MIKRVQKNGQEDNDDGKTLQQVDAGEHQPGEEYKRDANNICRARGRIRELALCNDWQYFATFTLAADKQDRYDLGAWYRAFGNWIGNYNRKYNTHLRYLIIPEQHGDGAWHAHGLLDGVAWSSLTRNEYGHLDLPYYRKRFGFVSLDIIRDRRRIAGYITKYVSKDVGATPHDRGEHLFYSSRGLQGRDRLSECRVPEYIHSAWENDYCGLTWGDYNGEPGELENLVQTLELGVNPFTDYEQESVEEREQIRLGYKCFKDALERVQKKRQLSYSAEALSDTSS